MILYHITKKRYVKKISYEGIKPGKDGSIWLVGQNTLQDMLPMLYPSSYDLFIVKIDIPKDKIFGVCRSLYGEYGVTKKKIFLKEYRVRKTIPVESIISIDEYEF